MKRSLSPFGALELNLLDMIGVGPFLTLPLLLAAMGGPQAMLGWLLGALLAVCDGLVWAELGAAMPEAGGTYRYLAEIFPGKWGRWLSFLFVFQLCFSAPLSIASGCIGLAQYAGFLWPSVTHQAVRHSVALGPFSFGFSAGGTTVVAVLVVLAAVLLQRRSVGKLRALSFSLLAIVLATILLSCLTGLLRGHLSQVVSFPPGAWRLNGAFFAGLGSAMLIATYDYWGYYNISFLGAEVRDPERTIPRVIVGSICLVAVLYIALNASVLSVMGTSELIGPESMQARHALLSIFIFKAWLPVFGPSVTMALAKLAALLVMLAAFASVFSLLLGYSRIPYAAARDGNFLSAFARLDRRGEYPVVSLLALALVAAVCCFFSLSEVIAALVILRILLQFFMQHVGVLLWRRHEPQQRRPFRMWLYPLPPLVSLVGFGYIVVSRTHAATQIALSLAIAVAGSLIFLLKQRTRNP